MATCNRISKDVELSPSTVLTIKSPRYPDVNYKNDIELTWNVTAPATIEEIFIDIEMDIVTPPSGLCEDYLQFIFPKRYKVKIVRLHVVSFCCLIIVN